MANPADNATFTVCCEAAPSDAGADGLTDADHACAGTMLAPRRASSVCSRTVAADAAGEFVYGDGDPPGITLEDTGGCSAAQIIAAAGLGNGHSKFGISEVELRAWVNR